MARVMVHFTQVVTCDAFIELDELAALDVSVCDDPALFDAKRLEEERTVWSYPGRRIPPPPLAELLKARGTELFRDGPRVETLTLLGTPEAHEQETQEVAPDGEQG